MIKNSAKKGKNRKGQTGGSMVTDMKSFFVTESGKKLASYYTLYFTIYVTLCLFILYISPRRVKIVNSNMSLDSPSIYLWMELLQKYRNIFRNSGV